MEAQTATLSTNGLVSSTFTTAAGSYYIVVKHRNTIQTSTSSPVSCTSSTPLYDFTTAANKAFGNVQGQVETGVWAMYTGDMNQDEFIDSNDFPQYDLDSFNAVTNMYVATDLNGDGFVDGNDFPIYDLNSFNGISSIHP